MTPFGIVIRLLILWLIVASCTGCATLTTEQEDARLDHIAQDVDVWVLCSKVYKQMGRPTVHVDHSHDRMRQTTPNRAVENMRSDIMHNGCRMIYKQVMRRD
jgi:hypothetical protein